MINASRSLFNARVLTQETLHCPFNVEFLETHRQVIEEWHSRSSRGLMKSYTETQLEQQFLRVFFVDLLDYVPIGRAATHNIVPKRTAATGKDIPDFVLGTFTPGAKIEKWVAVGELKSLGVYLDAPQSRYPYETPVEQAFRYAAHGQAGVEWVIVSNLEEIRLYRNGYVDAYERWTTEELTQLPKLRHFFFLLHRAGIIADRGVSRTATLLDKSLKVGLDTTEGFYGLYSIARNALIEHLVTVPQFKNAPKAHVYGKAHKILNRALFAAYCEDHPARLLPEETLAKLQKTASEKKGNGRYWETYQEFFRQLDAGSPPGSADGYNAFNGGLFAFDPEIDNLTLPDTLFTRSFFYDRRGKQSREITGIFGFHVYSFTDELNVDALGAIFEQSLKDLPTSEAPVRGRGNVAVTSRETHGVYYTPKEITRFMVSRAFDFFVTPLRDEADRSASAHQIKKGRSKRATPNVEIRRKLFFQEMMDHLKAIKLHDPACGSGAFLIEGLRHFGEQYASVNAGLSGAIGVKTLFALDRFVLRNNLHGWDILEESTELAKLSIWLRTASQNEPLESLKDTIAVADSLRTDESDCFDIIVSNPPWGAELEGWTDEELVREFPNCGEEKDSYAIFLILAHRLLRNGGIVAYIMPNSFQTTVGYESFRRWLLDSFDVLEIVNVWKVFQDVNHDACIMVLRKKVADEDSQPIETRLRTIATGGTEASKCARLAEEVWRYDFTADAAAWANQPNARFETIYEPRLGAELDRIGARSKRLDECCNVTVGIQVYHQRKVSREIIESRAFHSDRKLGADWYPFITGNEVQRYYQIPSETAFLKYSDDLCDKRELAHYKVPRVLIQQIFWNRIASCISYPSSPFLYLNTLFSLTSPVKGFSLEYLLSVLNSRVVSACFGRWSNRLLGDKFPKVSKVDLARIPMPIPSKDVSRKLNRLAKSLSTEWQTCKESSVAFGEYLSLLDTRGLLAKALAEPWAFDREKLVAAISETRVRLTADQLKELIKAWKTANTKIGSHWDKICEYEADVDALVARAYGFRKELCKELIERAPALKIEDVLLPR
ncbi:MAG TPA: N-6 DNA methylase [Pirellulales bacterium]|jgi:hypothetical protein